MAHMSITPFLAKTQARGLARFVGSPAARRAATALALLLAAPLGGCGVSRVLPPPVTPPDYHDRHPIVLADAPQVMDLFPSTSRGRLDEVTAGRIVDFVAKYKELGHGQISILVPAGSANGATSREGVTSVRRGLAAAGVRGNVLVGNYPVVDSNLAAPIRLSFQSIKAKVAGRCGEWPQDLASGSTVDGWENQSYWNFGCATQATIAAQVADPRDLASPRGQTPSDIEMRMRAINRVRMGRDPSTMWMLKPASISTVGGGN